MSNILADSSSSVSDSSSSQEIPEELSNNNNISEPTTNSNPDIPSAEEQARIISELDKTTQLSVGVPCYLIPTTWFNQWKSNVGYKGMPQFTTKLESPIPTEAVYDSKRRASISNHLENINSTIITKEVWEKFKEWYGGKDAELDVIENPTTHKPQAIYKKNLTIVHYNKQKANVYMYEFQTVLQYKIECLRAFGIKYRTQGSETPSSTKNVAESNTSNENVTETNTSNENVTESNTSNENVTESNTSNENVTESNTQKENATESNTSNGNATESNTSNETENIPSLDDFRIFDYWNCSLRSSSNPLPDKSLMKDHNIFDNNDMLLDYKKKDGKWKSEDLLTATSTYYNHNHYFSYGTPLGPGKVGFQNLGNTCFFNSGVQCLMHSKPLVLELLKPDWDKDLNVTNPLGMHGNLAKEFQSLLKRVWEGTERVLSPSGLKYTVGQFATQFSGWGQQDSHELITFMLDGIHEDLNRCRNKPMVDTVTGDGTNDVEKSIEAWENHKKRNDSIVVDHFHGQLRSRLLCPKCHQTTVVFDPFMALSLPIKKPNVKSLPIIFVPPEFTQPHQKLLLNVSAGASTEDYAKAISEQLGRDVDILLATYSRYQNIIQFGILEVEAYHYPIYYAFEIKDKDKVYVPCSVCGNYQQYAHYPPSVSPMSVPFLLPLDRSIAVTRTDLRDMDEKDIDDIIAKQKAALEEEAADFLRAVWDRDAPGRVEDDQKALDTLSLFKANKEEWTEPGHKFGCLFSPISYNLMKSPLVVSVKDPQYTKNFCNFYIGDEFRKPETGFSFSTISLHAEELQRRRRLDDDSDDVSLEQCFEFFASEETLDENNQWFCPKCREFVCANKKMDLWRAPQCLIIHLKRFSQGVYVSKKDERMVNFPDVLDISKFLVGPHTAETKYQLYAVSEHMGGMGGGHYTAHCLVSPLSENTAQWYSFNDSSVSESSASAAHNQSAYVLFYQRIDSECPVVASSSGETPSTRNDAVDDSDDLL